MVEKRNWIALLANLRGISWEERGISSRLTLSELLNSVAQHVRLGEEQQQELQDEVKNIKKSNVENLTDDALGIEWDELVLDDLDPEEKSKFAQVKEAVLLKRIQNTNCQWKIVQKASEKGTKRGRPKAKAQGNKAMPKFSTKWIRKRANPWKNEESSKRQRLKGGEMENKGAAPSQGAVPGESVALSKWCSTRWKCSTWCSAKWKFRTANCSAKWSVCGACKCVTTKTWCCSTGGIWKRRT